MGMRSGIYGGQSGLASSPVRSAGSGNASYASGGTSSYPVTGFPASAYLGNNRRSGASQAQGSTVSSALGNIQQLNNVHVMIVLGVLAVGGYALWHLDNKR